MAGPGRWSAAQRWRNDPRHVRDARAFVARQLLEHDLADLDDVVRLVVSELATNAVRHAATDFDVTVAHADGVLTVSVWDGSPVVPVAALPRRPLSSDGRGLHMVATLSDAWGVTSQGPGKRVWATFATDGTRDWDPDAAGLLSTDPV